MKPDTIETWVETLKIRQIDISAAAWRFLRIAAQYEQISVSSESDVELRIVSSGQDMMLFSFPHARGHFRMILARIGSFYMEEAFDRKIALYGFEGEMAVEDNFGRNRILTIEMRNRNDFGIKISSRG